MATINVLLPKIEGYPSVAICPSDKTSFWIFSPDVQFATQLECKGHYSDLPYYPDHLYVLHGCTKRRQIQYFKSLEMLNSFFVQYIDRVFYKIELTGATYSRGKLSHNNLVS